MYIILEKRSREISTCLHTPYKPKSRPEFLCVIIGVQAPVLQQDLQSVHEKTWRDETWMGKLWVPMVEDRVVYSLWIFFCTLLVVWLPVFFSTVGGWECFFVCGLVYRYLVACDLTSAVSTLMIRRTCRPSQLISTPAYNHLLIVGTAPDRPLTDVVIIRFLEYARAPASPKLPGSCSWSRVALGLHRHLYVLECTV